MRSSILSFFWLPVLVLAGPVLFGDRSQAEPRMQPVPYAENQTTRLQTENVAGRGNGENALNCARKTEPQ